MFKPNRFFFKLRGVLLVPLYLLAVFCIQGETEHWIDMTLGGLVFSAGLFIRIWSQMHLHYRLKEHKILTRTGPYALVRNPIYIGNTLLLCGITLICELIWLVPFTLLACMIVYTYVVRYEENHLTKKYGAPYKEYLSRIPRWLPTALSQPVRTDYDTRCFLWPSLVAEAHILLLLILPIAKEIIHPL